MASRHSKFGRCAYIALGSFDRLGSIATDSVCNFDGDKWDADDLTSRSRCGNKKGRAATARPFHLTRTCLSRPFCTPKMRIRELQILDPRAAELKDQAWGVVLPGRLPNSLPTGLGLAVQFQTLIEIDCRI